MNASAASQKTRRRLHRIGRYSKGLKNQNGEHVSESNNFDETQV